MTIAQTIVVFILIVSSPIIRLIFLSGQAHIRARHDTGSLAKNSSRRFAQPAARPLFFALRRRLRHIPGVARRSSGQPVADLISCGEDSKMDSQGRVGLIVDDMFFASKIRGAAEAAGRQVARFRSREQIETDAAANPPHLFIIDLNSDRLDPVETIALLKSRPELSSVPVVAFLSHVEVEIKRRAEEAGCDYVLPRSLCTQKLSEIVSGRLEGLPRR